MDKTLLPSIGIVAGIMTLAYYVGGREEVKWAESHSPEEFDRSPISVPKDWERKDYPYEKRVTAETKFKWCENCGELDDSDEDAWPYYQFVLKQKNSTKPVMRFISGGACEGCGTALCQNCIEGRTSGNFNPLFEPACDDCGYIFCKECKDEDEERCHSCQERYEEDVCDCCGHVHHAESETFESPVTCNICGKTFDSYRGLNGHMNAHKGRYSFIAEGTERDLPEIIPGYFIHTPDEKFGPYANIMEADTAAEKLMSEGVQVLGITKEGFEGVVSYEALEYSAESFTSAAVTTRSLGSAEKYECPTCKIVWYDTHTDHDFDTAGNPLCPLCAHAGYVSDAESFGAEGFVYFYTLDEDGFGDHYDTLEEAQAAVAASSKPMEIHERREDIHEPYKMDKRMGAESELTMRHKRMINRDIPEGEPMMFCEGCGERNEGNWESSTHACNSCFDGWMDNFDHSAESKLPPAEKAGITGVTSGATMEGLETLLAADEDACPVCEGDMDFDEAYRVYPYTLCYDCAGAVQDKRYDHAYSAEGELEETQEELAEVRTELSKSRTSMSMIRTGLAIAGFILLWEHHKWAKEEHDSKENRV